MNLDVIAISKIDGGYLISCGDAVAVRQTYDDLSFLIKKWLDDPPRNNRKGTLADLLGYKTTSDQESVAENIAWVEDVLNKN